MFTRKNISYTPLVKEEKQEEISLPSFNNQHLLLPRENITVDIKGYTPQLKKEVKQEVKEIPVKGNAAFEKAFDEVVKEDPSAAKYRVLLTKIAEKESGFNPTIKNPGAPAYGYFQFMQGTVTNPKTGKTNTWNNISNFAGVDIDSFLKDPKLQIKAAIKLAKANESSFNKQDIDRATKLGFGNASLIAGAWLGGAGNVKRYLHEGKNTDDKSWNEGKGIDMETQLKRFSNVLFGKLGLKIPTLPKEISVIQKFEKQSGPFKGESIIDWKNAKNDPELSKIIKDWDLAEKIDSDLYMYGKNQRLALLSMIAKESSMNPLAKNKESGAYGYGQWLGPRLTNLDINISDKNLAHKNQIQYLINSINSEGGNNWHHGGKGSGYNTWEEGKDDFLLGETAEKSLYGLLNGYTRPFNETDNKPENDRNVLYPQYKNILESLNKYIKK